MTPVHLGMVKDLRAAKGLSQKALAERAGIRQATLSDIEAGRTGGIDFATLEALADALGVNAGALVVHEPSKRRR